MRDPNNADLPTAVQVIEGNARSTASVAAGMDGLDVVVSALGMGLKTKPNGLMTDAAQALVAGAEKTGVHRLVMLSSWGVGETRMRSSLPVRLMYRAGKKVHDEKAEAEKILRTSTLDTTLLYPVALTNGPATGSVRVRDLQNVDRMAGTPKISRADVAQSMLDIVEADGWSRRTVVLDTV